MSESENREENRKKLLYRYMGNGMFEPVEPSAENREAEAWVELKKRICARIDSNERIGGGVQGYHNVIAMMRDIEQQHPAQPTSGDTAKCRKAAEAIDAMVANWLQKMNLPTSNKQGCEIFVQTIADILAQFFTGASNRLPDAGICPMCCKPVIEDAIADPAFYSQRIRAYFAMVISDGTIISDSAKFAEVLAEVIEGREAASLSGERK